LANKTKNLTDFLYLLGFFALNCLSANGQSAKQIEIKHADVWERIVTKGQAADKLRGAVILTQEPTTLACDSAISYSGSNYTKALGRVNVTQNGVVITGEQGDYYGNQRKVDMVGKNVTLQDPQTRITTTKFNYGLDSKIAYYYNGATIENKQSKLTSKRGYYNSETFDAYFKGNVHVEDPKYQLDADTLKANNKTKIVTILAPTHIVGGENGKDHIYAAQGFYDSQKNYAEFWQNARLEQDKKKAVGDKIRYDGVAKKLYLEGHAHFEDGQQNVTADTIVYDETTGGATTRGKSKIVNGTQIIDAGNSSYDKATGNTLLTNGVKIVDTIKQQIVIAQTVSINKKTHENRAEGNASYIDDKQGAILSGGKLFYNDSTNYLIATEKPMLTNKIDQDSLFLRADTIRSTRKIEFNKLKNTADTTRQVFAHHHVRFYKKDLQGVSDSLFYSTVDSVFRFYGRPLMWADTTQLQGDTINVHLKDKKIEFVDLLENAFVINSPDLKFFNQVKGKKIRALFNKEKKLEKMDVKGGAESLYYAIDAKKAYIGLNKVLASSMLVFTENNKITTIHYYTTPTAQFVPMRKANHKELSLKGWEWQHKIRPRGKWDLEYKKNL
jgi:lipopolysaccharide export system protein LptA